MFPYSQTLSHAHTDGGGCYVSCQPAHQKRLVGLSTRSHYIVFLSLWGPSSVTCHVKTLCRACFHYRVWREWGSIHSHESLWVVHEAQKSLTYEYYYLHLCGPQSKHSGVSFNPASQTSLTVNHRHVSSHYSPLGLICVVLDYTFISDWTWCKRQLGFHRCSCQVTSCSVRHQTPSQLWNTDSKRNQGRRINKNLCRWFAVNSSPSAEVRTGLGPHAYIESNMCLCQKTKQVSGRTCVCVSYRSTTIKTVAMETV